ncbi:unnamed protein product, partial [Ixodes persulcatus]
MSGGDRTSKVTLPVKESLSVVEWVCPGRTGFEDCRPGAVQSWESRSSRLPSWRWLVRGGQVFETAVVALVSDWSAAGRARGTRDPRGSARRGRGSRWSASGRVGTTTAVSPKA